jgi:signal transduction histidine kinase
MPILSRVERRAWWPAGRAGLLLALIVLVLTVLGALDLAQHYRVAGGPGVPQALTLARLAPLLLVWSRPVAATGLSLAAVVLTALVTTPVTPAEPWPWAVTSLAGHAAVVTGLGARHPAGRRVLLPAAWTASQLVGLAALAVHPGRGDLTGLLPAVVLLGLAAYAGDLAGGRAELARTVAEQQADIEGERARRARLEERARVARELHDVVAHHLSVVVARADSAPVRLPGLDEPARQELAAIAEGARESLTEMRRVLRLLREGDGPGLSASPGPGPGGGGGGGGVGALRTPQPGLADLPALLDRTRATGATVTLTGPLPPPDGLPETVQLTAYRVVQEGLTNAIRHAPGAPVTVTMTHRDGWLAVDVSNPAPPAETGPGHGLRGLAERAAALGGTADAAHRDGAFRLSVRLPTGRP